MQAAGNHIDDLGHWRNDEKDNWHVNVFYDQEDWNQQFDLVFEHEEERSFADSFSYQEDRGIVVAVPFSDRIAFSDRSVFAVGVNLV